MAIWTLTGQNLPVSVSGANLTPQVNMVGAQPADFNPDAIIGYRFIRTITGSALVDDSWTDTGYVALENADGNRVATVNGPAQSGLGDTSRPLDLNTPGGGLFNPSTVLNKCNFGIAAAWATYEANMKNDNGTLSITALTVEIEYTPGASPAASFDAVPTTVIQGDPVQFTDTSSQTPNQWSWDFDGGAPGSTAQNPQVTFDTPGVYNVVLTATNNFGSGVSAPTAITVLRRIQGSAAVSGVGSISAVGGGAIISGSAAVSGAGAVSDSGLVQVSGPAAITGASAINAFGGWLGTGPANGITAGSSITDADGTPARQGFASLSAVGSITEATGVAKGQGAAAVLAIGAISADGVKKVSGAVSISALGIIKAEYVATWGSSMATWGDGRFTWTGQPIRFLGGGAAIFGAGSITATGRRVASGSASISAVGSIDTDGYNKGLGVAEIFGPGSSLKAIGQWLETTLDESEPD